MSDPSDLSTSPLADLYVDVLYETADAPIRRCPTCGRDVERHRAGVYVESWDPADGSVVVRPCEPASTAVAGRVN